MATDPAIPANRTRQDVREEEGPQSPPAGPGGHYIGMTVPTPPFRHQRPRVGTVLLALLLAGFAPLRAIIVFGSDDPAHNTTAPAGALAGSGWQWEGQIGFALGTVIGPRQFITATHLQFGGGSVFQFRGLTYHAVGKTNLAGTDLDVFTIAGRFPDHAPLCTTRRETGRPVVMFGRGGRRGAVFGTHGWQIGDFDAAQRWGTNLVDSIIPASESAGGELLAMGFGSTAGADEGIFSAGDSGGGTFLLDRDNVWKLAGVNYGVDGPFTADTNLAPQFAAVFDARGLYVGFQGQQQFVPNSPAPVQARSIVTRVSSHVDWIAARVAEPARTDYPTLESAVSANAVFVEEPFYAVDAIAGEIRAPRTTATRLFRLQGATRIRLDRFEGDYCVFTYQ